MSAAKIVSESSGGGEDEEETRIDYRPSLSIIGFFCFGQKRDRFPSNACGLRHQE